MKRFLSATTATIVLLSFATTAQASSSAKAPHLAGSFSSSNNVKFRPGNHEFKVHVTGQSISALMIEPQHSIRLSENIKVFNQFNKPVAATVSINGKTATITLVEPVKPDTTLRVELYEVQNPNSMPIALFSVSTQVVGFNSEIPLGTVQVTTKYGRT